MKKAGYILIATIAIFAACNLLSTAAFAGSTVKFAWDANSEPDLAGYRLFQRVEGGSYDYSAPAIEISVIIKLRGL